MSARCPHCGAGLAPKDLKPGRYAPKCLKCQTAFVLHVQWATYPDAAAMAVAQDPPLVPVKATDPTTTGAFTEPEAVSPAARQPSKSVVVGGAMPSPGATGDFTEPDGPREMSPPAGVAERTGEFTDSPETGGATGEFTEADAPAARGVPDRTDALATGDFTAAPGGTDNVDFSVGPKPVLTPKVKPKLIAAKSGDASEVLGDADAPARLGGYEVLRVLGRGGMGAVLLGRQISLDRKVALKVMHPKVAQNPSFVARFTREAYAAAQLTHHNVVQVYDIGEDRGRHFFSMEFVNGQSLGERLKEEGKLSPEAAVGLILQAARGLRYGHKQGMVHRDIKPDNLMVNDEGVVKVADLGLVKLSSGDVPSQAGSPAGDDDDDGITQLTHAGAVMGTPAYMAPEQGKDSGTVDQRADVYSLGCTLYVLLTGKPPFEGKTALEIITKHQTQAVVPPEVVVKRVPKALSAILLKMMAKKPADRYASMDEVVAALEGFLGVERGGTFNPKESQADELEKFCCQYNVRGKGKLKAVAALAFAAACGLGVVGAGLAGMPGLAGGILGLLVMTPLAYFVTHGVLCGNVVFTRARVLVFGMGFTDWLMVVGGGLLFLATLYLFGLLWSWIAFAVAAAALAAGLWYAADRAAATAQKEPLDDARSLLRSLRLQGLDEEALRQFVCKYAGPNWEPFYEGLFGYEAKLAARAYRKGDTGEPWTKQGTWREPVVQALDARLEARRLARERKHLQRIEAKALEAEGVSKAEAKAKAAELAEGMVEQAAEATQARKEGKEVSVREMVAAAKERRRPNPGKNIAGKPLRSMGPKYFLNAVLGQRTRFVLGAAVFAAGLLWMSQNGLLSKDNNVLQKLTAFDFAGAGTALDKAAGKPLQLVGLPAELVKPLSGYPAPVTGFLLMMTGVVCFGWRPSAAALPGAALALLGPSLLHGAGVELPISPEAVCLAAGAVLIAVGGWLLRS
ncbi:serine/threonine-protein kinase [Urbifossiella limnaea]|uniref:non-specific serine/threonine protein kinase n=1 Tax=Urbifossiella limnaea TaxID=2528023 RepID=A0A517XRX9_9BACT|nr:serine/threonine-protein kinase [Urbifossiella limnaea]QDU20270.1 Serine/threonine-protein kinase PknB [Urbifossiella limnaea]